MSFIIVLIFAFVFQFDPSDAENDKEKLMKFMTTNQMLNASYKDIYPIKSYDQSAVDDMKDDTHFYLSQEMYPAFERFIDSKKDNGSEFERRYYQSMSANDLIQKCIKNRAIIFYNYFDVTLLQDVGYPLVLPWELIGTDKYESETSDLKKELILNEMQTLHNDKDKQVINNWKMEESFQSDPKNIEIAAKFSLTNYLSYDEMHLCSFMMVGGKSKFGNDCGRFNGGKQTEETEGYIVGAVGPRFENTGVMDRATLIKEELNEPLLQIIYGEDANSQPKYETWESSALADVDKKQSLNVNTQLLEKRYEIIYKSYISFVYSKMKQLGNRKKAYISVTGLGAGVWAIDTKKQSYLIVKVIKDIIKKSPPGLAQLVHTIDFTYFPADDRYAKLFTDSCVDFYTKKEKVGQNEMQILNCPAAYNKWQEISGSKIDILFSLNTPASKKKKKMIVV